MNQISLHARFLGVSSTDPSTLLGVPAHASQAEVLHALRSLLAVLEAHPDGQTDEADLVRESLHAAARQLIDRPPPPPPANTGADPVIDEVRVLLSAPRGLSEASFARLTLLANARGSTPQALIQSAMEPSPAQPALPPEQHAPRAISETIQPPPHAPFTRAPEFREEDQNDPAATLLRMFVFGSVIAIVIVGMALILLVAALREPVQKPPAQQSEAASPTTASRGAGPVVANTPPAEPVSGAPGDSPADPQSPAMKAAGHVREWADLARDISACISLAQNDPVQAATQFENLAGEMSTRWIETTPDSAVAASNSVIDLLYALGREPEQALRIVRSLSAGLVGLEREEPGRKTVLGVIWSSAMLSRAARERDLPVVATSEIQHALSTGFGAALTPRESTYVAGLHAALLELPGALPAGSTGASASGVLDAWKAWIQALSHAHGRDSREYDLGIARALERILIDGAEPNADRVNYDISAELTLASSWRKESPLRTSLLQWLQSSEVTAADLQAVTSVLATRSGATGIDPTMILSAAANAAQRAALRDAYAAVWELSSDGRTRSQELVRLADAARARLSQPMPDHIAEVLQNAVVFARYSRIADELRRGVIIRFPDDVESFSNSISNRVHADARGGFQNTINNVNEQWAAAYLREEQAGNLPAKLRLLQSFSGEVDRLSAEVLVDVSVRGSPDDARKAARQAVLGNLSSPELVNSFLRQQHRIPPTPENSLLIERICVTSLPSPREPSWRLLVRRALVARLLQLLAGDGELAVLDMLAKELQSAYGRDHLPPSAQTQSDDLPPAAERQSPLPVAETPAAAALRLLRELEQEADRAVPTGREPVSLPRIILQHRQRHSLARGPVQAFAAHQIAVADLLAYLTVNEIPSSSAQVAALMEEMSLNRNKAAHIIDQVHVVEETILRLWLLRIDAGESPAAKEVVP